MSPRSKQSGSDSDSESASGSSDDSSNSSATESESASGSNNEKQVDSSEENRGNSDVEVENNPTAQQIEERSDSQDDHGTDNSSKANKDSIRDILRQAAQCPDLYAVRRSGRDRKTVERLNFGNESDSDEKPKRSRRGAKKRNSGGRKRNSDDESGQEESGSDSSEFSDGFRPAARQSRRSAPPRRAAVSNRGAAKKGKRPSKKARNQSSGSESGSDDDPAFRNTGRGITKKISYKEQSDDVTESDDLISMEEGPDMDPKNDSETVERVLSHRKGRKAATGHKTTLYNVLDNGDPNKGFDPAVDEIERQYFIKWKNWSHIHNTWETEGSLKEQTAKKKKVPTATLR